jgi:hypothetical protein
METPLTDVPHCRPHYTAELLSDRQDDRTGNRQGVWGRGLMVGAMVLPSLESNTHNANGRIRSGRCLRIPFWNGFPDSWPCLWK